MCYRSDQQWKDSHDFRKYRLNRRLGYLAQSYRLLSKPAKIKPDFYFELFGNRNLQ